MDDHTDAAVSTATELEMDPHPVVGIIGLGYVGLPLAMAASRAGLDVVGFDVDQDRVDALTSGSSHVEDVTDGELRAAVAAGAEFTTDRARPKAANALLVAVPSPLGRHRQPDMAHIASAAETVAEVAQPGMVVSLESTTYPGTTEEYFVPPVERAA